jgi:hypothetical protein
LIFILNKKFQFKFKLKQRWAKYWKKKRLSGGRKARTGRRKKQLAQKIRSHIKPLTSPGPPAHAFPPTATHHSTDRHAHGLPSSRRCFQSLPPQIAPVAVEIVCLQVFLLLFVSLGLSKPIRRHHFGKGKVVAEPLLCLLTVLVQLQLAANNDSSLLAPPLKF